MDGKAGWWTTSRKIRLPPLARVKGVVYIAAIVQSVSALDFNFERIVGGLILTAGKKIESEKT